MQLRQFTRFMLLLAMAALVVSPARATSGLKTYYFGVSDQRTNITFESETDFEIILGSSHKLSGTTEVNFDNGTAQVHVVVPVASLRTGIDLRDEHLRSAMWLDAEQHPNLSFVSKKAWRISKNRWRPRRARVGQGYIDYLRHKLRHVLETYGAASAKARARARSRASPRR